MSHYEIDGESLEAMTRFAAEHAGPIVMVNLLRMREHAVYPADAAFEPCSGQAALKRYEDGSAGVRRASGARVLWGGAVAQMAIAPSEEAWDAVVLVEYPSASAYLEMRATPEYEAARLHRRAALYDSRLIMTVGWG
jgi:uncharacterized protein (DUF1330 family)